MAESNYFNNIEAVDKWHLKRWSKFTSSQNHKLMTKGKGEMFSTGGFAYIKEKAVELTTRMWSNPKIEEVESLRHGNMYESLAYVAYMEETRNTSMELFGTDNPLFIDCSLFKEESGGSPDMCHFDSSGKIDFGGEIKSPWNPAVHFDRLDWKDQWDLKMNMPAYYCQVQDLLRLTGAFGWHFISFDERQISKKNQIKIIEVLPDRAYIDELELRINSVIKEKYKIISRKFGKEIKNKSDFLTFAKNQ